MVWCLCGGIRSNLVWVMLCQFLLSVGPVRVRTSLYKCAVQCTAVQTTQYRVVCSTAAIADSDVRRSGPGREWSSLQSSKFETHSAVSQHKNCSSETRLWDTEGEGEAPVCSEQTPPAPEGSNKWQRWVPSILTLYNIYTHAQLAKLMVYSLQKYKFQLCNCFRSRTDYWHLYLVNVLILQMSSARVREHHFMSQDVIWNIRKSSSLARPLSNAIQSGCYWNLPNLNICILVKLEWKHAERLQNQRVLHLIKERILYCCSSSTCQLLRASHVMMIAW